MKQQVKKMFLLIACGVVFGVFTTSCEMEDREKKPVKEEQSKPLKKEESKPANPNPGE